MPALDKKIIISADDFGQSPLANKNILELLLLNKLQRVSVMVNGKISPAEIQSLLNSQAYLDLHLDLSGLFPDYPFPPKKTGAFGRLLVFFKNYLSGKISVSKVAKSWDQQLEKFHMLFGRYPAGLNSHEHIHFFPPYFKLILALAKKAGTSYLRLGQKDFLNATNIISWIIFFLRKINRRRFLASDLNSSDFFVSLDWLKKNPLKKIDPHTKGFTHLANKSADYFGVGVNSLPSGKIELIVHPERKTEWEFLKS